MVAMPRKKRKKPRDASRSWENSWTKRRKPKLVRYVVEQTTLAVMVPITMAPGAFSFPSLFVFTVAEIKVLPQAWPVAVAKPVALTVTMAGVFEVQVT